MRVLQTIPFTFLRMSRDFVTLLLLLAMPIVLITVFYFILGGVTNEAGYPAFYDTAIIMTLVFQLFGGSVVMHFIQEDLLTLRKQRFQISPLNRTMYAFSLALCGTLFSMILGFLLLVYTSMVLNVEWGNWLWVMFVVSLMAILSTIVSLICLFVVTNFKVSERLTEVYGVGFVILAGLFFPMPDHAFFTFINEYVNPLMLSVDAVLYAMQNQMTLAWQSLGILGAWLVVMFAVMYVLGRRRLT
ncbi:ABC transporter permease [Alkalihalobacillus pseudalcaliphilus]|uniref:ABC transporter permease n=1 Tax=Alkalihalobacillus pseudalcaliphilus TaxID=79884 RepID=UPI00064D9510|nr:ABC transporter permease [Alkalihalobacillus pseudalcaliphilus]KMK77924.1 multidrug ABC transporter permease [Alkalihalobacillus pseudalcaliphilus]